jgi:2-hydroxy-3-keto-5-methylthiopentenyl-1-phosphate phosphatase
MKPDVTKTVVQCDFDGTVTEEDVSFAMLDAFAPADWRRLLKDYQEGRVTVGRFNAEAFGMVKAGRRKLLEVARKSVKLRSGFPELVACCRRRRFRLVIVSNGLDFYIKEILATIGLRDIEVFAARTRFHNERIAVKYIGPDGRTLDNAFKEAYVDLFLREGYRVIYVGNGDSDFRPARKCHYVFATGNLLAHCQRTKADCIPFSDFHDVVRVLEQL